MLRNFDQLQTSFEFMIVFASCTFVEKNDCLLERNPNEYTCSKEAD
jgi:hypothetical protein